jgi:hypothetical protein
MSERTFEELLDYMRAAAGKDVEARNLVSSFEETVVVIAIKGDGKHSMERYTEDKPGLPDGILLLFPPGLEVRPANSDDEGDWPMAFIDEIELEGGVKVCAVHLLGDECASEWLGLQLILNWHQLQEIRRREHLRTEFEDAIEVAVTHGAAAADQTAFVESYQAELSREEEKSELAMIALSARLLDAKLSGALSRAASQAPTTLRYDDRADRIGRQVQDLVFDHPPVLSEREEDTRDFILNLALNWYVLDEARPAPSLGTLC